LRSGGLRDDQLADAVRRHGVKTVFSFTHGNNAGEQAVCDTLGVERFFCYLPGDGIGPDDPYLRFLQVASDPKHHPVLVHCSAGVQRTGGAVALFRTVLDGWSVDDAVQEMIRMGNEGYPMQIDQVRRLTEEMLSSAPGPRGLPPNAAFRSYAPLAQ
ncbi:MAG: fused DSP-PTPase phosphatase/NAD kinase-like protein, partial [Planctomycetia bacterium]